MHSLLQTNSVKGWLQGQARNKEKAKCIKPIYQKKRAEVCGEKQINEMFKKLDADGSNAIDMMEMRDLFAENGINMAVEQIAEMFSVVKEINDKEWLTKNSGSSVFIPIVNKHKVTLEDKLKL